MDFNIRQQKAIELLAVGDMEYQEIASTVGVTGRTLLRWRRRPDFAQAVQDRALALLRDQVPSMYRVLNSKSQSGNIAAMRLMFERLDRANQDVAKVEEGTITFTWNKGDE